MVLDRVWEDLHGSSPGDSIESCAVALGHCASLHVHGFLRTLFPTGMRCQRRPVTNVSTRSLFWAVKDSLSTMFPRERGTKACLSLPLEVYHSFLALSLLVLISCPWLKPSDPRAPAPDAHQNKRGFSLSVLPSLCLKICASCLWCSQWALRRRAWLPHLHFLPEHLERNIYFSS